jgi:23S rRNA (cytidine1920-2'-O)/16S rRNA (cytidine1409-2'-O)-methyltransferase
VDLAVVDVSFISLRLALPPVLALAKDDLVALIKPQFEAGREQVKKGGVVRDPAVHERVLKTLADWSNSQTWHIVDIIPSPIKGPAGNVEFLSRWKPTATHQPVALDRIQQALAEASIMQASIHTDRPLNLSSDADLTARADGKPVG